VSAEPGLAWASALARLGEDGGEDELAAELLGEWLSTSGCEAGALYLASEGKLILEQPWGAEGLPELLDGELPPGFRFHPLPGGLLLYRRAAEAESGPRTDSSLGLLLGMAARLATLRREIKRRQFEVGLKGVEQQALYDVGLAITSMLDREELSEAILTWALSLLDARRAALYLAEGTRYRLTCALNGDALPAFDLGPALPTEVLPGARHLLSAPIEIHGQTKGLLVVADKETRLGVGPFGEADQRTLALFANQAAISLENARLHREALEKQRLEREMELAAEIQRQILPKSLPTVPGYTLAGWNRPARQVGGDYYDLLLRDGDKLLALVGDVSGKGVPAALLVSTLHSALRLMLDHQPFGPELLERLNRHVFESSLPSKFITLLLAELDRSSHRVSYLNAGHNQGVALGIDGTPRFLGATGVPLGLMPRAAFRIGFEDLNPGETLCLYSDGITECSGSDGEEFGLPRLVEVLVRHAGCPLEQVIAAIDEAVTLFAGSEPQGDDQTVVLLRRDP
jgi:phosphoserine phosphatase RsbU/P